MTNRSKNPLLIRPTRRTALKIGAASATFSSLPLLSACSSSDSGTTPSVDSNETNQITPDANTAPLIIGATIPLSGAFADEGRDQQRGLELAVQHLNGVGDGGMLNTMQPSSLQGNGVLGRPVEFVVADTETRSSVGETAARQMITEQQVSMLVGSSSSGVALAVQSVAQELGVVYMPALSHANEVTGANRSAHGFRQYMNSQISGQALATTLARDLGTNRSAYYLTADFSWGDITGASIQQATEQLGWQTIASVPTPVGNADYATFLEDFLDSNADVLVLVHYGNDMVNSLTQAQELGIPQLQRNGNNIEMAIPVYTTLMARAASDACAGVYGTINWHWSLQDSASTQFTSSYEAAYGVKPSEAAHIVYAQTLQYADAVERAGSTLACDVIAQLEAHRFSGLGNGQTEYRQEDHQCFKDTLVAVGRDAPTSSSDLLEIRNTVPRADLEYAANSTGFAGELGACNNGV